MFMSDLYTALKPQLLQTYFFMHDMGFRGIFGQYGMFS